MFIVSDFQCAACGAVTEHLVKRGDANPECPECGNADMTRLIGAPKLGYTHMAASGHSTSDAMTTSIDKWARAREQKRRIEMRNVERHGTET